MSSKDPVNFYDGVGPREIGMYMYLRALTDINGVDQSFKVKYYLYTMWAPTRQEYLASMKDPAHYRPEFLPELRPQNMISSDVHEAINERDPEAVIHLLKNGVRDIWGQKVTLPKNHVLFGRCTLSLDLLSVGFDMKDFPFDYQHLHMVFEADENSTQVILVPSFLYYPSRNSLDIEVGTLASDLVYRLLDPVIEFDSYDLDYNYQIDEASDDAWSTATFTLKVERKWSGYFWRILFLIALLEVMNICIFFLDNFNDTGNRFSVTVTILLAMVAFQYVVSGSMPAIPYLSYADKYVLFSFIYVFAVIIYICIGAADAGLASKNGFSGEPLIDRRTDSIIGLVFLGAWFVKQIIFVVYAIYSRLKSSKYLPLTYGELNRIGMVVGTENGRLLSAKPENNRFMYRTFKDSFQGKGYAPLPVNRRREISLEK